MKIRGRRPVEANKSREYLEIRVQAAEKQAFRDSADLAGIAPLAWVREQLRRDATRELEDAAPPIAFMAPFEAGEAKCRAYRTR